MNKILVPSPVFRGKTLWWKWNFAKCTRSNVNKGIRFASGTIKSASLILQKGRRWEWINMQGHSQWLHAIRKRVPTEKKCGVKIWKYTVVFASTQLRITRLRKYPIDPNAYLGRCWTIVFFEENSKICKEVTEIWLFNLQQTSVLKAQPPLSHNNIFPIYTFTCM